MIVFGAYIVRPYRKQRPKENLGDVPIIVIVNAYVGPTVHKTTLKKFLINKMVKLVPLLRSLCQS